jgi:hypothetical protein
MDYENENETPVEYPDHLTVEYQTPPVKDQLVQATIGIGAALAPVILYVVGASIYSGVSALRARRKAKKLAALTPEIEAIIEDPTLEEE